MAKRQSLAEQLDPPEQTAPAEVTTTAAPQSGNAPAAPSRQSDRAGKKNISAWFSPNVALELEELRIERTRALGRKITLQELLGEAYNDLFKKYGRPELVPTKEG